MPEKRRCSLREWMTDYYPLSTWAKKLGISENTIYAKIKKRYSWQLWEVAFIAKTLKMTPDEVCEFFLEEYDYGIR